MSHAQVQLNHLFIQLVYRFGFSHSDSNNHDYAIRLVIQVARKSCRENLNSMKNVGSYLLQTNLLLSVHKSVKWIFMKSNLNNYNIQRVPEGCN